MKTRKSGATIYAIRVLRDYRRAVRRVRRRKPSWAFQARKICRSPSDADRKARARPVQRAPSVRNAPAWWRSRAGTRRNRHACPACPACPASGRLGRVCAHGGRNATAPRYPHAGNRRRPRPMRVLQGKRNEKKKHRESPHVPQIIAMPSMPVSMVGIRPVGMCVTASWSWTWLCALSVGKPNGTQLPSQAQGCPNRATTPFQNVLWLGVIPSMSAVRWLSTAQQRQAARTIKPAVTPTPPPGAAKVMAPPMATATADQSVSPRCSRKKKAPSTAVATSSRLSQMATEAALSQPKTRRAEGPARPDHGAHQTTPILSIAASGNPQSAFPECKRSDTKGCAEVEQAGELEWRQALQQSLARGGAAPNRAAAITASTSGLMDTGP